MASIRGKYEDKGVQRYYEEEGSRYSNPHFPILQEVVPSMLDQLLPPLMPLSGGVLDLCCGSGEFTLIFRAWLERRQAEGPAISITGADPYTRDGYARWTGQKAERWSFQDICDGVLEEGGLGGDPSYRAFDLVVISYAVHLLERSRYFAFFQSLARSSRHMLIISPTKNKGLVETAHGWEEVAYVSAQKVHSRMYKSLLLME
mmetsp:Transcript_34382/g.97390  ORF Transcript_34382/g.97390 Transcript_34382/m.97390 type:complete len:203 (+) Transcript_34382:298-906(+)